MHLLIFPLFLPEGKARSILFGKQILYTLYLQMAYGLEYFLIVLYFLWCLQFNFILFLMDYILAASECIRCFSDLEKEKVY